MALQVAQDACAAAGVDPAGLASVFTSAHGDLAIVDALCRTLAHNPLLLSPTALSPLGAQRRVGLLGDRLPQPRSQHRAGGGAHSFAAGCWKPCQCRRRAAVLLVACDTEAMGPLQSVNHSRGCWRWRWCWRPPGPAAGDGWSLQGPAG
jgi:hypothetical protein